jgi:hypothetical protein
MRTTYAVLLIGAYGWLPAAAADAPPPTRSLPTCEVAIVNPVSGFAECVKPRGAKVDPPPPRPMQTPEECREHPDLAAEGCRELQPGQDHGKETQP